MSILLTVAFPMALAGAGLPSLAANAAPSPVSAHVIAQAAKPVPVKAMGAAPRPVPPSAVPSRNLDVVVSSPAGAAPVQLVQIQSPAPAPQAGPSTLDRNAIVDRVSKALTDVKTAQGKFTQVDAQGAVSSGVFYINRPGKIRFEYDKPEPMFIVSDGVTVSIEEPKRDSWDSTPLASTQLHLFLRTNVDLKRDVADVKAANGSYFVTLVDKTGEADGRMILEFRASDFELLGWRALDGTGAETKVALSGTRKNVSLKPSLFVVKDPSDSDHR